MGQLEFWVWGFGGAEKFWVWRFGRLGVWAFGCLVVVPFVPFVASVPSPPKKEKRFPNRFHKKTPSVSKGEAVSQPLPQRTTSASSRSGKDSASPLSRAPLPAASAPPTTPIASVRL